MKPAFIALLALCLVGCGKKKPVDPAESNTEATTPVPTKGINQTSNVKIGTPIWEFETGRDVYASPAIGSGGTVYVGSIDIKLYATKTAPKARGPCVAKTPTTPAAHPRNN
ncbi:MAG: PQQ-binding-like beta-propeller repeat protein [Verrucomicrobiota bacterium]|jgi:predicted small lipoprotein YifL|nr:PQQ-binding-like beta-propeller repeat protein [Verrucomicrobiota bacterium]